MIETFLTSRKRKRRITLSVAYASGSSRPSRLSSGRAKYSLVTGAARGIGQAIADRLARNGSVACYADLVLAEAQAAASATPNGRALKIDVTKPDDIASAVQHSRLHAGLLAPSRVMPFPLFLRVG